MGMFIFSVIYIILIIAWLVAAAFVWYLTFEEFWAFLVTITLLYIAALLIVKKKKKLEEERRKKRICAGAVYSADNKITGKIISDTSHSRDEKRKLKLPLRKIKNRKRCMKTGFAVFLLAALLAGTVHYYRQSTYIPESLIEFAEKYPEAADFVNAYPKKKNINYTIDLTDEVEEGSIPLFIQWDERWGYRTYGSDCMGITGCGPTCLSMILYGLTGTTDWDPYSVALFSEEHGYYVWGEGSSWNLMTEGAELLGLQAAAGTVSAEYIQENLSASTPMIASMYPGDFTYTGHFIVLTGIDEDGNVTVNDPNSPSNSSKTWSLDTLVPQIRSLWIYKV